MWQGQGVTTPSELRSLASTFLGTPVSAAAVVACDVSVFIRAAGGSAASSAADAVGLGDSAVVDGVTTAAGMRMAQEAAAQAQGLTGAMLIAITDERIVLLDWDGNSARGTGPSRELASFAKADTRIEASTFGATRKVALVGPDRTVHFSAGVGWLSSGKAASKEVLKALDAL